jgi:hypothetical protein
MYVDIHLLHTEGPSFLYSINKPLLIYLNIIGSYLSWSRPDVKLACMPASAHLRVSVAKLARAPLSRELLRSRSSGGGTLPQPVAGRASPRRRPSRSPIAAPCRL